MRKSDLWIPKSARELLLVGLEDFANATDDELNAMLLINQAGTDWLNGKLDTRTYTDILLQYGFDPSEIIDAAEDYVNTLIRLG